MSPVASTAPVTRTTATSEVITQAMLPREPPILRIVSISRRLSRSDSMNTSTAVAKVESPTTTTAAITNVCTVRIVSSSSSITVTGCTIWARSSGDS